MMQTRTKSVLSVRAYLSIYLRRKNAGISRLFGENFACSASFFSAPASTVAACGGALLLRETGGPVAELVEEP